MSKTAKVRAAVSAATRRLTTAYTGTEHPGTPGTFDEVATDTYGYDNAGDVTADTETTGGAVTADQCFTYDYARRLTQAWTTTASSCQTTPTQSIVGGADSYWQSYGYDLDSDRTSKTDHNTAGDTTRTYTYPTAASNQPHAVTSITNTAPGGTTTDTYTYDADGNLKNQTVSGAAQTRTYDPDNHLATAVQAGQTTSYIYDTTGKRLISHNADGTTTAYLGSDEVIQTGTILTDTRYYGGLGVRTAAGLTWTIADPHGTGETAINATTLAVTHRRLDPFGNLRNTSETWPTNKSFLNDTQDPTGTIHIGAREYAPTLGRFTALDPVLETGSPQQLNGYSYAANSPVTNSDPTGLHGEAGAEGEGYDLIDSSGDTLTTTDGNGVQGGAGDGGGGGGGGFSGGFLGVLIHAVMLAVVAAVTVAVNQALGHKPGATGPGPDPGKQLGPLPPDGAQRTSASREVDGNEQWLFSDGTWRSKDGSAYFGSAYQQDGTSGNSVSAQAQVAAWRALVDMLLAARGKSEGLGDLGNGVLWVTTK